jgi:dihydrofolate reductase
VRGLAATVLKGDVVNEVSKLPQELDGDTVVCASRQLAHTLLEHDLVDELRLMVYPVVLVPRVVSWLTVGVETMRYGESSCGCVGSA